MKEPERIPLSDSPRKKEPSKIRLHPKVDIDDTWDKHDTNHGPIIFAKKDENHLENNSESIQELESDQTN